ncbi:hypothetical protein [Streptococcus suis]|uniref:hypothetical protein n=1 Tax=Streptococcus suis TaxID=1307 RepID=UPI0014791D7B
MNCLIKNVKEFVLKYNKVILVFLVVIGLLYSKTSLLGLIVSLFSISILFVVFIIRLIAKKNEELETTPLTFITGILAALFALFPLLIFIFDTDSPHFEPIRLFYTIAVGTGVNYVIESLFKYVEIEAEEEEEKKQYTKYSSIIKFVFNSFYIAVCAAILIIDLLFMNYKDTIVGLFVDKLPLAVKHFLIFISLTLFIFCFILILEFQFVKSIKKEIKYNRTKKYH